MATGGLVFQWLRPYYKVFSALKKKNRKPNRKQGSFCFNYSKFTSCQRLTNSLLIVTCCPPGRTLQDKLLLFPSRQLPEQREQLFQVAEERGPSENVQDGSPT
ncbi:rCG50554 [Rattus norvegicus]|uniref:RCG50554 n=1 Tax=Rattus norvegicus TaxID=10116 RepID=A6KCJ2_RAT|nr:rCG50554 [Rattus norvegicus]